MKSLFLILLLPGLAWGETIRSSHKEQVVHLSEKEVEDWRIEFSTDSIIFYIRGSSVSAQEFSEKIELKHGCPQFPGFPFMPAQGYPLGVGAPALLNFNTGYIEQPYYDVQVSSCRIKIKERRKPEGGSR